MSNVKTLHRQWADGEIEAGTLIEALYEQEQTIAILRQHKNDYMDAAECTRKYLEAELAKLRAELERRAVPDALREAVEYLDDNRFNQIGAGSILHRAMSDALAAPSAPTVQGDASVPDAECRRLLFAFGLECNTIGLLGAAENLHKGMKVASSAAIAAARQEGGK